MEYNIMNNEKSLERIKSKIPEIKKAVAVSGYEVTPGDVSVRTGLPILEVEHALKELVSDYYGGLKVSEEGDLVYFFPHKFNKNRYGLSNKFKEWMKSFFGVLYKGFQFVYKASIMVILVAYFVIFLILFLAIMMASRGNSNRGGGRRGGFNIFFWMWLGGRHRHRDEPYYGRRKDEEKKPFYKSVFNFIFGEENPNEFFYKNINKIVAKFIQNKKGAIISEELTPITGTKIQNTNIEVSKYVGKFQSEPEVTDNGTVILTFPRLLTTSSNIRLPEADLDNAYYEKTLVHNGNKTSSNIIMCAFNAFNLLVSGIILSGPAAFVTSIASNTGEITPSVMDIVQIVEGSKFLLGSFPFIFSILFFLIPLIRYFYMNYQNGKIRKRNLYKAVAVAVMERGPIIRPDSVILPRGAESYVQPYNSDEVDKILYEMAISSACNLEYDDDGNKYYDFTELHNNLQAVYKYRRENIVGKRIRESDIDYNTEDDFFDF
jgi:hypothetical protein